MKQLSTLAVLLACLVLPGMRATAASSSTASTNAFAFDQVRAISGTVTDEDGVPVVGATVTVVSKATGNIITGTYTNADGQFSIQLSNPSSVNVKVSYLGYSDQVISGDADDSAFSITLAAGVSNIDETVVIGYQSQSEREITGSVAIVNGDDVAEAPALNFEQSLAGRAAGVQVSNTTGQLGAESVITIRGIGTLTGNSRPLVVVDGIIVDQGNIAGIYNQNISALGTVNPQDIETYVVLKDGAATSAYGSRGANGVIVITTKKGRSGKPKVTASVNVGFTDRVRDLEVLNAQEFVTFFNQTVENRIALDPSFNAASAFVAQIGTDSQGNPIQTDWQDELFRTGFQQRYTVGIEGGTESSTYRGSLVYDNQEGIMVGNNLQRLSGNFGFSGTPNNWLKISFNFAGSYTFSESPNAGGNFSLSNTARLSRLLPPNERPFNEDGTLNVSPAAGMGIQNTFTRDTGTPFSFIYFNPYGDLQFSRFHNNIINLRPSATVEVRPVEWLTIASSYGISWTTLIDDSYHNNFHGDFQFLGGLITQYTNTQYTSTWTNSATFAKTFATDHKVTLKVAQEFWQRNNNGNGIQSITTPGIFPNLNDTWASNFTLGGPYNQQGLISYFGILNYSYKGKYNLQVNARSDGWSGFTEGNQWGNFFGVSASWDVAKESWFDGVFGSIFSDLRLKASYGEVGQIFPASPYIAQSTFGGVQYGPTGGLNQQSIADANIQWEENRSSNFSLIFGLLDNKVYVDVQYFINDLQELIAPINTAGSLGIRGNAVSTNIASMTNKGLELSVRALVLKTDWGLTWNTALNFTTLQNEVTKVTDEVDELLSTLVVNQYARVGDPIGIFELYDWAGVNPQNGRAQLRTRSGALIEYDPVAADWVDQAGNGGALNPDDRIFTGNPNPTYFGGWSNTLTYKGLELSFNLVFQGGNQVYNQSLDDVLSSSYRNKGKEALESWSEVGQNAKYPQFLYARNGWRVGSTLYLEDADFLNMQLIQLRYNLPSDFVRNTLGLTNVSFSATVQNAFLITGYSGVNPEASSGGAAAINRGIDQIEVPLARQYQFGVNVTF